MVVAATGFFDGVHLGHKVVLDRLKAVAAAEGKESAVITFWPHPRNVLQKDAHLLRLLNSIKEKEELVKSYGIDHLYVIEFTKEFSQLTTEEFLRECLVKKYNVSSLIVGYDHRVGRDDTQGPLHILDVAKKVGVKTYMTEPLDIDDNIISSTKIRNVLKEGMVEEATKLLGYRYSLTGVVVSGNMIGRTIGFPTANMQLYEPIKMVPRNGVYVVDVYVLGQKFIGICNIGNRPTVSSNNGLTIETNILDFNENIYGLDVRIDFVQKIRDEKKFDSLDLLKEQLKKDAIYARNCLK